MNLVDRYWEWRRRRALDAPFTRQERSRELALVVDAVMERRRIGHLPRGQGGTPPSDPCSGMSPEPRSAPMESEKQGPPVRSAGPLLPTVLAAVDGMEPSAEVGRRAVRLAQGLGARLVVLSFVNARLASRMGVYRGLALAELERDTRDTANRTEGLAAKSGVGCEVRRAFDPHPSRAIVVAAREVGAECIVIGSPGASVVDRLLDRAVGGVHRKVLREAECSVLSVGRGRRSGVRRTVRKND